jgi:hypothetical protein
MILANLKTFLVTAHGKHAKEDMTDHEIAGMKKLLKTIVREER